MNMLFNYKEAFSLRDEIGTCPNIEVEMDVTDKSPFCKTMPCQRERQGIYRQRNEVIELYGNSKGRIFSIPKPCNVNKQEVNQR